MKNPKRRYDYDCHQLKCDLVGEDLERFEKIREKLGYKYKGELLRKLILQALSLIDKNYLYVEEQEEAEELTKYYDQELDYMDVCEVITKATMQRRQYIKPTER